MSSTLVPFHPTTTGLAARGVYGDAIEPSSDLLKEALSTAQLPPTNLRELLALRRQLTNERDAALGIEAALKARLKEEIAAADLAILAAKVNETRQPGLSFLDPEVLRWRHPKGVVPLPKLALVDATLDGLRFAATRRKSGVISDLVYADAMGNPPGGSRHFLNGYYEDVNKALRGKATRLFPNASLTFRFEGAIPAEARKTIKQALAAFPAVYLLVDAPPEQWVYERAGLTDQQRAERAAERRRRLDPLILGCGGEKLWVLGAFDASEIEEYVQSEFTTKA